MTRSLSRSSPRRIGQRVHNCPSCQCNHPVTESRVLRRSPRRHATLDSHRQIPVPRQRRLRASRSLPLRGGATVMNPSAMSMSQDLPAPVLYEQPCSYDIKYMFSVTFVEMEPRADMYSVLDFALVCFAVELP